MERRLNYANRISKAGRILDQSTKELGRSNQSNGHGKRNDEKVIWQEETKFTRTKRRRQYIVRSQEYSFEQTLKEAGPKTIQTL